MATPSRTRMIPVITNAGSHLGFLLGGTVIIESIFSLPGVGLLTLNAIQHRDVPQLEINVLFLAFVFTCVNLAGGPQLRLARPPHPIPLRSP